MASETSTHVFRRGWLLWLVAVLALWSCSRDSGAAGGGESAAKPTQVLRVARSKQLTALAVLELRGGLEKKLAPLGFGVEWLDFLAGPQQFEAFNSGALDLTFTAESPPLFAQAARGPVVYLAATARNGALVSLVVPPSANTHSIADLKGKRIGFQKSSIGHYLAIKALEGAGLRIEDVEQVNLAPPDASAALTKQSIDAWFIWEPFVTRAVQTGIGRVLLDGAQLRDTTNFVTTSRSFAEQHPDVLRAYLEALQAEEDWCAAHKHEVAKLLSPRLAIDVPTLESMHDKTRFGLYPISEQDRQKQQEVADMWLSHGFLPLKLDVSTGFLPAERYAALVPAVLAARAQAGR